MDIRSAQAPPLTLLFPVRLLLAILFTTLSARANNIDVANTTLASSNPANDSAMVQFDLSWDNSWRNATNWDAAWVFVKFREPATTGDWAHATLSAAGGEPTAATGSTIDPAPDGTGVFIHREANGTGSTTFTGTQLRWNYGADGVSDTAVPDIQVFAIEMVYVPRGAFAAGDAGSGGGEFDAFTLTTINTAAATTAPSGSGALGGEAGGYPTGQIVPPLNDSWPNGFDAFYCMKYEINQGQYAEFLNSLTSTQAAARLPDVPAGVRRYSISGAHPNHSAAAPDRACNYMGWQNGSAYADWSGLRPMTELEFEKACRGTAASVPNEYAWGDTSAARATGVVNDGTPSETPTPSGANTNAELGVSGPLRVGSFASSSSSRAQAGAGFYGAMELSGNLEEQVVCIYGGSRGFTGMHGDGALSGDYANVTEWPDQEHGSGAGHRGGSFGSTWYDLRVSGRARVTTADVYGGSTSGFRCVRSRPTP